MHIYLLNYKHIILSIIISQILALLDIFFKKRNILSKFITPFYIILITISVLLFVNPPSYSLLFYGMLSISALLVSLSSYINKYIISIIIVLIAFYGELLHLKYLGIVDAWKISIAIIKSIMSLLLLKNNNIPNQYKSISIYCTIPLILATHAIKSFSYNTTSSMISYSICDWQQGLVLLSISYIGYLGSSIIGNYFINKQHNHNNIALLLILITSIGGIIGIISTKYIFLILPIIILSIFKIINYIMKLFHGENRFIDNIINYLEASSLSSELIYIIITIFSGLLYNISLY